MSASEVDAGMTAGRTRDPFLVFRDDAGRERVVALGAEVEQISIGRRQSADVVLDWDEQVSRLHARLERVDEDWTVVDDGLSRNGTFVNGERIHGRRRLGDGDSLAVGATTMTFRSPLVEVQQGTALAADSPVAIELSSTQRRVLVALCRPYKDGAAFSSPATNQQIADELFLSVDAVKTHMRVLFAKFAIGKLPQNQKRARLVERAFHSGVIAARDL